MASLTVRVARWLESVNRRWASASALARACSLAASIAAAFASASASRASVVSRVPVISDSAWARTSATIVRASACASLRRRSASALAAAISSSTVRVAHAVCSAAAASTSSASAWAWPRTLSASVAAASRTEMASLRAASRSPRHRCLELGHLGHRVTMAGGRLFRSIVDDAVRVLLGLFEATGDLLVDLPAHVVGLRAGLGERALGLLPRLLAGVLGLGAQRLGVGRGHVADRVGLALGRGEELVGAGRTGRDQHGGLIGGIGRAAAGLPPPRLSALPRRLGERGVEAPRRLLECVRAAPYRLFLEPHCLGVSDGDLVVLALRFGAQLLGLSLGGRQLPARSA